MEDSSGPGKLEIQEIFRRLRNVPANRACFDCNTKNPTWASVTYGVFICIDCSAVHRSLGVHLSFVRSIQLDTNWTWTQLRNMQLGGNGNASSFFTQHNSTSSDAQQKYNSRAAHLYREKLNQIVAKYNKIHGNKIVFDDDHSKSPVEKDADFFDELHQQAKNMGTLTLDNTTRLTKSPRSGNGVEEGSTEGPNVHAAFSDAASPTPASTGGIRKSTIGQRKPMGKLGAKKVGLGAQKVKADFSEIEKEAEMQDQMKEQRVEDERKEMEQRAFDEEKQLATMRLAYQDLSKQQKKREEQLKHLDPKKAEQVERLGMGIGIRGGISHSAMSDIKSIEQDTPSGGASTKQPTKGSDFFDDFEILLDNSLGGFSSKKSSDWSDLEKLPRYPKPAEDDDYTLSSSKPARSSRVVSTDSSSSSNTDEAQKKFGNAKAISSDQYFTDGRDNDFERRTNLSRFDGSKSISSADYFGDGAQRNLQQQQSVSSLQSTLQNVDLDDVKESVRQGVTKVAGRLTNLANGMMSSLQEKYGY